MKPQSSKWILPGIKAIASNDLSYVVDPVTGSYVNAYVSTLNFAARWQATDIQSQRERIVRYNVNGTIDSTFQTGAVRILRWKRPAYQHAGRKSSFKRMGSYTDSIG
jgi:hypothetical protein